MINPFETLSEFFSSSTSNQSSGIESVPETYVPLREKRVFIIETAPEILRVTPARPDSPRIDFSQPVVVMGGETTPTAKPEAPVINPTNPTVSVGGETNQVIASSQQPEQAPAKSIDQASEARMNLDAIYADGPEPVKLPNNDQLAGV